MSIPHTSPLIGEDQEEAQRAAETFVTVYQVTLIQVEEYLEEIIIEAGPELSGGYRSWLRSIRELTRGTLLLSKKAPLQHQEQLLEALRVFSLTSAAQFINDLCLSIGIQNDRKWSQQFSNHVQTMMASMQNSHQQEESPS